MITATFRSQKLIRDEKERFQWKIIEKEKKLKPQKTAIIVCDMWDKHWGKGIQERLDEMAPRMNEFMKAAREKGITIIHAPSDTMEYYKDSKARERMESLPKAEPPSPLPHDDPPLPVDASDGGSDTGEPKEARVRVWTKIHPAIEVDHQKDGISDIGEEIYNYMKQHDIEQFFIMGVATNMCVLRRPFAIKRMVRWGVPIALIRDFTDAAYNPASPPYVSQKEGTKLCIEYIEKFWCPSVESKDLLD